MSGAPRCTLAPWAWLLGAATRMLFCGRCPVRPAALLGRTGCTQLGGWVRIETTAFGVLAPARPVRLRPEAHA